MSHCWKGLNIYVEIYKLAHRPENIKTLEMVLFGDSTEFHYFHIIITLVMTNCSSVGAWNKFLQLCNNCQVVTFCYVKEFKNSKASYRLHFTLVNMCFLTIQFSYGMPTFERKLLYLKVIWKVIAVVLS